MQERLQELRSLTKKDAAGDKHSANGDHEKAVEQWVSALSVDESHAVFHTSTNLKIASSYLELKDYSNAKRHCDAVLSQDDKNVDALIKRTEAEIGAEDYESARRTAARAREVSDDDRTRKNQQKAEVARKQSKEVNHYKVLGVLGRAHAGHQEGVSRRCVKIPPGQDRARRQRQRTGAADGQVPGDRRRVRKYCPTRNAPGGT